ncbi:hypothetical protein ABE55_19845 [Bacillus thuringiensis]|uniref:hypothetical protein n=1 Tax=Bacillus cereus group TaxID=86661 RepID=UPI000BF60905|nr:MULTISPECIES: hypothetical protein [Bacillus cereus group]MBG9468753.1 hypothetical protein [Bacillus thuringiensis]PES30314.1 hypothetical protein CN496_09400 [Bacillus cereus]PET84994.1 hypothetical protein CN528_06695 [Bacillus cereus]
MYFSSDEIEKEKKDYTKKPIVYKNGTGFPYNDLTDRGFEVLLYSLYKEEIKSEELKTQFDLINLMQGTGERGRDCTLHFKGKVVGVIQCKKYIKRVGKSEVAKEIIKFVLHYILDKKLIENPKNFSYYFAVSNDFTEPALELLNSFNSQIYIEENFELWTTEVIENYKAFKDMSLDTIREELKNILKLIKVHKITANDLNIKLKKHSDLIGSFFEVEKVITVEENKEMIKSIIHPIPKLIGLDEFKSRLVKKSNKLPFSNLFIGRNNELDELIEKILKGSNIVIIDGVPGIGKTRFTIELAERIFQKDCYDEILVLNDSIYNSNISLLAELNKDKKYMLLVDDANRIENLHELKELLFNHSLSTEPLIILNVRSYNVEMVTKEVKSWGIDAVCSFNLKMLTNREIDTILQQEPFKIDIESYRKEIVLTCKGNPRLAAIMAEVMKREAGIITDKKAFNLFESYFEGVFTDLVELIDENYKDKALLAIISMLRTIQLDNVELVSKIKGILQFENDIEFKESIYNLHKYEIIEITSSNSIIKIFDDSVSEYILFRYVLSDLTEVINFEQIFDVFQETHASNIIENLVALFFKGYESEKLSKVIHNLPNITLQILNSDTEERVKLKYLDWMNKYVLVCPKECFKVINHYWRTKKITISDAQANIIVDICKKVFYIARDTHLRFVVDFLREIVLDGQFQKAKIAARDFLSNTTKYYPPIEYEEGSVWIYQHQEIILDCIERWITKRITKDEVSLLIDMLSQMCKNHYSNDYLDYIDKRKLIMQTGILPFIDEVTQIRTRTFKLLIKLFKEEWVTDINRLKIVKVLSYPFEHFQYGEASAERLVKFDADIILQKIEELKYKDNLLIQSKLYTLIHMISCIYKCEKVKLLLFQLQNQELEEFEKIEGVYWQREGLNMQCRDEEIAKNKFALNIAKEINTQNYLEFLNKMVLFQSLFLMDNKSYSPIIREILRNLGKEDLILGNKIIDEMKEGEFSFLKIYLQDLLIGIGISSPVLKRKICLGLIAKKEMEYCREVAASYGLSSQSSRDRKDIQVFALLVDLNDCILEAYILRSLRYYQDIDEQFVKTSIQKIIKRCSLDVYTELLSLLSPKEESNNYKFFKTNPNFFKEVIFGTIRLDTISNKMLDYYLSICMKYLVTKEGVKTFLEYLKGRIKRKELLLSYSYDLLTRCNSYFKFINQFEDSKAFYKELIETGLVSPIKEDIIELIIGLVNNNSKIYDLLKELLEIDDKWIDLGIRILRKLPVTHDWYNVVEILTFKCSDVEKLNELYSAFYSNSYQGSVEGFYQNILENIIFNKQRFSSYEMSSFMGEAESRIRLSIKNRKERKEWDGEYI